MSVIVLLSLLDSTAVIVGVFIRIDHNPCECTVTEEIIMN